MTAGSIGCTSRLSTTTSLCCRRPPRWTQRCCASSASASREGEYEHRWFLHGGEHLGAGQSQHGSAQQPLWPGGALPLSQSPWQTQRNGALGAST
eukprot:CAMPEP_0119379836 /NCGR_PEP_ID=MMETSP1334-20130426/54283_1 /TAXON_ID=127549 /ORGANISM="Calcidiscus leptoporus, Strain RCC1130" /LENGTH=94 /DNA_ID=CAMNT_0007399459 /DNA_START=223 /DNA_END=503 /DNA_ORIENTATION=+